MNDIVDNLLRYYLIEPNEEGVKDFISFTKNNIDKLLEMKDICEYEEDACLYAYCIDAMNYLIDLIKIIKGVK